MNPQEVLQKLEALRQAAHALRTLDSTRKNRVLESLAEQLKKREREVIDANNEDLAALPPEATSAFRDRLRITPERISQMSESLRQVAALEDPVGEVVDRRVLANGLKARRERAALGVIFMIFESRPNVALEAFSLGFKAGNAMILRGGKESMRSTSVIYSIISNALALVGIDPASFWGVTDPDRALTEFLLKQNRFIDVVVPRGGEALINAVISSTSIPVIKNDRGLCHVYVHADADATMALQIVENAKCQRPGVCNAMETLLIHESRAEELLPLIAERLRKHGVQWHACPKSFTILELHNMAQSEQAKIFAAGSTSFDTEYLDFKINCRVVSSLEEALSHIDRHGSRHSESIITSSPETARRFQYGVDSAVAYWNSSTRFTDGFELGLGGELGISTQKLHVRGPVGLKELTSPRWFIEGTGQVRL